MDCRAPSDHALSSDGASASASRGTGQSDETAPWATRAEAWARLPDQTGGLVGPVKTRFWLIVVLADCDDALSGVSVPGDG